MDGLTAAQLRQDVVSRLQASGAITAVVSAAHIFDGRILPLPQDSAVPAICVFIDQQRAQQIGDGGPGSPAFEIESDLTIDFSTTALTTELLEEAMDFADTIRAVLLASYAWQAGRLFVVRHTEARFLTDTGEREFGNVRLVLTLRHQVGYP